MADQKLTYCKATNTVRTSPGNHLIAYVSNASRRWVCDPDPAAPYELCESVFAVLHGNHSIRYGHGPVLVEAANHRYNMTKQEQGND